MVKYACDNCGYSFVPKGERIPNMCPYCNKGKVTKQKTAQELLDESEYRE
ncbi:hypothetical protein JXB27_02415 [Candidatus Woesearchaeota archaeon]|nr:hypothetical protein [Candidatus Woesearchaeota archaeon]